MRERERKRGGWQREGEERGRKGERGRVVRESETERKRERGRERGRDRERQRETQKIE